MISQTLTGKVFRLLLYYITTSLLLKPSTNKKLYVNIIKLHANMAAIMIKLSAASTFFCLDI